MLISGEYKALNEQCHRENRGWGKGGTRWLSHIVVEMKRLSCVTVLDYGCGKGALVRDLAGQGFMSEGYDPAVPEYRIRIDSRRDYVVCTDVLEHIEYDCIDAVLADIADTAVDGAFLVISLRKAQKILPDGRNAHLIVENEDWWENKVFASFTDFDIDYDVYLTGKPRTPSTMVVYCRRKDGNTEDTGGRLTA